MRKLAHGLRAALPAGDLSIIANPGDDFELHGLTICPDHDTLLYTLADLGDRERGWGLAGETWNALEQFGKIGGPDWFRLGDRDLALHIHRTAQLRAGGRLTEVNREIQRKLGLTEAPILMATDDPLRTRLRTPDGWMEFQPWFVGAQAKPEVLEVAFDGAEAARPTAETLDALATAERIVIAPSNPLLSIAPILSIPGMCDRLRRAGVPIVAVAPLIGGRAIKGPTAKLMQELGMRAGVVGVYEFYAKRYAGLLDAMLIDQTDGHEVTEIGCVVALTDTLMQTMDDRLRVAQSVLELSVKGGRP